VTQANEPPRNAGRFSYARINASGVVAVGGTIGGVTHVFVLTPAP